MIAAGGSVLIAGIVGTLPVLHGGERRGFLLVLGGGGVFTTVLALRGHVGMTHPAIAALGVEYALFLVGRGSVDLRAPITGSALLVLAELTFWSASQSVPGGGEGTSRRRVLDLAALWSGSVAAGTTVVLVSGVSARGGVEGSVVGVLAAAGLLGLIARLARR